MSTILITGIAGFIGAHLAQHLAKQYPDSRIVGSDNFNDYYDPSLKRARLQALAAGCHVVEADIISKPAMDDLFTRYKPALVVHMAAQAGVRYSLEAPQAYVDSNITGFLNLLEAARAHPPQHIVYASSSSVYGLNAKTPFEESDKADNQVSLYGATKKANEQMAHAYAHLFKIPLTGLRYFTVYGPWGRPDMAYFKFADGISRGEPIPVYNNGRMVRDFTYIDDIVEGVTHLLALPPSGDVPHAVYNIGGGRPEPLLPFIQLIEQHLGKKAVLNMLPMQAGDVHQTYADTSALRAATGYAPQIPVSEGIRRFCEWYKNYYACWGMPSVKQ